ncbi:hypothetical protein KIW84_041299 [Lathyrus oleraceus]|uniref:Uncharacterized protein n=1 Tax=Pisum sativum TaxID=3888 RepID=A0A9D4X9U8_PEA|nr:hypothetical protein KIW84_041299 [Pisum sativum]
MSYSQGLQHLLQLKLVNLRGMPPPPERLPASYNPNARYFLDFEAIQFTLDNEPNTIQNPTPIHVGHTVNVMEDGENLNLIMDVNLLSIPLSCVNSYLIKNGVFPGCFPECCECQNQPEGCVNLKTRIQSLIDEGFLQCDRIIKDKEVKRKIWR